jgi:hypothetical protein
MKNNISVLQRELDAYLMQNNDFMAEKIQKLIDEEIIKQTNHNLNEIVKEEDENLNEIYFTNTLGNFNE